jgi:hypothetical protein
VPPVHAGDQPVRNPDYGYQQFVAIFKVSATAVASNYTQAELVAVVSVNHKRFPKSRSPHLTTEFVMLL